MFAIERRNAIISMIKEENRITVAELSKRLGVSVVTIRKDLELLETEKLVTRTYGGVILGNKHLFSEESSGKEPDFKPIIFEAAKLISPGQTIMLGSGKYTLALAEYLKNYDNNLTVITTSIDVALVLSKAPHIDLILTGGILRARTMTLLGHLAERVIKEIRFELSFSDADGIHTENGISSSNMVESSTEATLLKYSKHPIILSGAGAVGHVASTQIAKITPEFTIITDGQADSVIIDKLSQQGVTVIMAGNYPTGGENHVD